MSGLFKNLGNTSTHPIEGEIIDLAFIACHRLNAAAETAYLTIAPAMLFRHLSFQLRRDPQQLLRHVQRITTAVRLKQSAAIEGALTDLFITLKSRGTALRQRLLTYARPLISDILYTDLHQHLASGLTHYQQLTRIPEYSLLKQALYQDASSLVDKITLQNRPTLSTAELAQSYLDYGQLDEARTLLETTLLQHPDQLDLHADLLEIYEKTADRDHFTAMYRQLTQQTAHLPDAWHQLAAKLTTGSPHRDPH